MTVEDEVKALRKEMDDLKRRITGQYTIVGKSGRLDLDAAITASKVAKQLHEHTILNTPVFPYNDKALDNGLAPGDLYRTGEEVDALRIVHGRESRSEQANIVVMSVDGRVGFYFNRVTGEACLFVSFPAASAIQKGMSVCFLQGGTPGMVSPTPTSGNSQDMPIGIALNTAAQYGVCRVAKSGLALVLPDTATTATFGYLAFAGNTTAGRLAQAASVGTAQHNREQGHFMYNGTAAGALTLATIHHN